jgi:hypothetical protein
VYSLMMGNVLAMLHFLFYLWAWISFFSRGLHVLLTCHLSLSHVLRTIRIHRNVIRVWTNIGGQCRSFFGSDELLLWFCFTVKVLVSVLWQAFKPPSCGRIFFGYEVDWRNNLKDPLVGWLNNLEEFPSRLQLTSWMFMLAPCTQPPWQKHLLQAWSRGLHFPDFEHLWRCWELPLMANLTFSMSYLHCTAENVHSPLQHDVVVALQSCPRCSHCRHASALRCGGGGICSQMRVSAE